MTTSSRPFRLSRRTALRGLGAAVALPFLDAMTSTARAQSAGDRSAARRLVFFYVPCGIDMATFLPSSLGRDYVLSPMLAPLERVRDSVSVVSGLRNTAAEALGDGGGDHARGTGAFLTAVHPLKSETQLQNGPSVDQVAAGALRGATRLPSLELGCESGSGVGACDIGYSCAYSHNISWASPTVPMPKEVNPRAVFDRLFAGADAGLTAEQIAQRRRRRASILDFVRDDARALQARLGASDNAKLDEYLTGVRELEQRIEAAPTTSTCAFPARPAGADADVEGYVKQMLDLAALSMQCDLTRVATFMLGNGGSNRSYGFLGHPGGHHEYSHHQGDPDKLQALADIGRWEISMVAHLMQRLRDIPEGDGNALDNSLLFFSSELEDGNSHGHDEMPVLLVGKGGGMIDAGQHLRIENAELGDVFLTMLKSIGVEQASFGEYGTRVLDEIIA